MCQRSIALAIPGRPLGQHDACVATVASSPVHAFTPAYCDLSGLVLRQSPNSAPSAVVAAPVGLTIGVEGGAQARRVARLGSTYIWSPQA